MPWTEITRLQYRREAGLSPAMCLLSRGLLVLAGTSAKTEGWGYPPF
jgi:hypothetical protein